VTVDSGCGEVFVIQAGFFLQGESASNLIIVLLVYWFTYWFSSVYLCFVLSGVVVATLDLKKEQLYVVNLYCDCLQGLDCLLCLTNEGVIVLDGVACVFLVCWAIEAYCCSILAL